ncbi:MAG: hypothetical protein IJV69_04150 [Kiritimatiellae bacterium]|nr:hypothetical protein [Kiritimatiellia bacterium]
MKHVLLLSMILLAAFAGATEDDGMAAAREALLSPGKPAPKEVAIRDTKITADHMEYNYKESVAILTDNVVVDDARFHLTSDKLFVFLESANTLDRLLVLGNVKVTNEDRRAECDKAVYIKAEERLVMSGNAKLHSLDKNGKTRTVAGDKITIWTKKGDQRMEVYPNPELIIPAGSTDGLKDMM